MNKKILIVGYGSIGKKHHALIKDMFPEVTIKFFRHNISNKKNSLDSDLYTMDEVKAFNPAISFICNPASNHIEQAIKLGSIGSHLFIEKPLALNMNGITTLKKIIKNNKLIVQVGYNLRYLDSLIFLKKIIEKEQYGRPLYFKSKVGQNLSSWRKNQNNTNSISLQKNFGGGVIYELSHEIDYLLWLFNSFNYKKVTKVQTLFYASDVEDTAFITLGNKKNDKFNIIGDLSLDFVRQDNVRECEVICESATIKWLPLESRIIVADPKKEKVIDFENDTIERTYSKQLYSFFNSIIKDKSPLYDFDDGVKTLKLITELYGN